MFCVRNLLAFFFLLKTLSSYQQPIAVHTLDSLAGAFISKIRREKKERAYITTDKSNTLKTFFAKGYRDPPVFAVPSYDTKKQDITGNIDLRHTVYWNGNILPDKDGKATINFYTNDIPKHYTVTIHEITARGYVVYKTIAYQLK